MGNVAELNEQSTKEEVQAYVKQVVDEVKQERAGEQKTDAQITSEQAGKPAQDKIPAETKSGSDTAIDGEDTTEVNDQGEELGEESESQDWLTDDLKAEAAAFGISESDISDFASREELERALRFFDKSALEAGRKALAETESESEKAQTRNDKGQFAKKEEPKTEPPVKREGQYEFKTDIYDEDLESDLKGLRDHYDSRLAEMEQRLLASEERLLASEERFAEAEAVLEAQQFDAAIDALNMPKLFGTTDSETPEELKRREDVLAQAKVLQAGYRSFGRNVEIDALVSRAAPMVFASEFDRQKLKEKTRKISKQSNGRQGGGATRPQDPSENPRDKFDRLYRELDRG